MEEKINLTERQIELIEKFLRNEIPMFGTPIQDMKDFMPVIKMAEDLVIKTQEDSGDDLIKWFYDKYLNQRK